MPFIYELNKYINKYFVETGTYKGDTIDIVLKTNVEHIISIELSDTFYYNCINKYLKNKKVKLFKGNSRYDLHKLIHNINSQITFWLDGHWSGVANVGCDKELKCPVLDELEQIKSHFIKNHTIIIDDIRLMDGKHFEVTKEQIENKIFEINFNYIIKYYDDDYACNDILVAYIDKNIQNNKICIHNYLMTCKTNKQPPGLGDFLRGTIALFNYCKKYNYDIYLDNRHIMFTYLLDNNRIINNNIFNETVELLPPLTFETIDFKLNELFNNNKSFCIMTNSFYTRLNDNLMVNFGDISSDCKIFLRQILTPNKFLNEYLEKILSLLAINKYDYEVIHIRTSDEFENNGIFDIQLFTYLDNKIKNLLKIYKNKKFVLISDSCKLSNELKNNNPNLLYWSNKKIHLGDLKHNDTQKNEAIINTLIDLFIIRFSNKIYSYAFNGISGFSKIISLIYDIEYINIDLI